MFSIGFRIRCYHSLGAELGKKVMEDSHEAPEKWRGKVSKLKCHSVKDMRAE